jgi:prevent-host-death family protein
MSRQVAMRELRNDTAGLLRRVRDGESITITARGRPVASLVPLTRSSRGWLGRDELVQRLSRGQADSGLRADLARLAGDTTDDLPELRA